MNIPIGSNFCVSEIGPQDAGAYIEHLREREIYERTLTVPYPYTPEHAKDWIQRVAEEKNKMDRSINWAIRRPDGYLVGGIGYHDIEVGKSHRAEIGYWLAKPYWGQGLMTEAVKKMTDYGFDEFGLVRVVANVFIFNPASARVLVKAGYQLEGTLRQHYKKDGKIFDGQLYSKIRV